jgi:hypothetical protein
MAKKPDISAAQAAKMSPKKIAQEILKGKTVSGYAGDEHGLVKDARIKDVQKELKNKGGYWHEGTVQTGKAKSTYDTIKFLLGK